MKLLKEIIKEGESETLSFIESTDLKFEISESMVSFSNTNGGLIIVGIKKNGKVKGVNPLIDLELIKLIASENCFPEITYSIRTILDEYKMLLVIEILEDKSKLYKSLNPSLKKAAYKRIGHQNISMSKLEEDVRMFAIKGVVKPKSFDGVTIKLIEFISFNKRCSLTKIHKSFSLPINEIDFLLTRLICWGVIFMDFDGESSVFYIDL